MARCTHSPDIPSIDLKVARGFRDQQKWEVNYKLTAKHPVLNDKY
jgi:hypothetical protein